MKKQRESGFELLRIILMLQVIFLHVSEYGKMSAISLDIGGNRELLWWLVWLSCRCPVYLFIAIQGYFMIKSKSTIKENFLKSCKVHRVMLFYSIGCVLVMLVTGLQTVDNVDIIKGFIPISSNTWYFMTNYILIMLFAPLLNIVLNKISRADYLKLIIILFLILSVWTMLASMEVTGEYFRTSKVISNQSGKSLYDFIFVYILGGFIRLHIPEGLLKGWKKIFYLVGYFGIAVINTILAMNFEDYKSVVDSNNNPLVMVQLILAILFFRELKFSSGIINFIAALNIGIYMIHEQPLIRKLIWNDIFEITRTTEFYVSKLYPFKVLLICVIIFAACGIIEYIRSILFDLLGKLICRFRNEE